MRAARANSQEIATNFVRTALFAVVALIVKFEGFVRGNGQAGATLDPEKVAYWYFRLNGFFQIENFIVHPARRGAQRTDADLLAVRFPYRAERLFDDPNDIMADDEQRLALARDLIDVVIAEVKTNRFCTLNGPWTRQDRQNVHRVLAAIGCLPSNHIELAAEDIYRAGVHGSKLGFRIRLVAVGRERSVQLSATYPDVAQLTWREMLAFIWNRLHRYRQQKTQVDQWDAQGRMIKRLADMSPQAEPFISQALHLMGVRHEPASLVTAHPLRRCDSGLAR